MRRFGAEGDGRMALLVGRSVEEPDPDAELFRRCLAGWPSKPTEELPTRCLCFLPFRLGELRRGEMRLGMAVAVEEDDGLGEGWKALIRRVLFGEVSGEDVGGNEDEVGIGELEGRSGVVVARLGEVEL
jgi:hypothetical protein